MKLDTRTPQLKFSIKIFFDILTFSRMLECLEIQRHRKLKIPLGEPYGLQLFTT